MSATFIQMLTFHNADHPDTGPTPRPVAILNLAHRYVPTRPDLVFHIDTFVYIFATKVTFKTTIADKTTKSDTLLPPISPQVST
ncbi:hypothetical protein [Saccharospirillum sp. MSK14-1]|uniref:hypothetical protein n=1 Tax=Saccharospirillum sp. MSK14-1 TaxID=1897632 RepID=UPI001304B459|nr:hypothetical protein [Saccharospirillum sp. MSK14-1]